MQWEQVRTAYPGQWLIIEALAARSESGERVLDRIAVVEVCPDAETVMKRYRDLHHQFPQRELYFVHTDRERLDIRERFWLGLRTANAT